MSTRGVIAKLAGDGWTGVYQHSSSYPTWLGAHIWRTLHEQFNGDVERFTAWAIDGKPQGWACFPTDEYDPIEPEMIYTHADDDGDGPSSIEWVYILAPSVMTIMAHQPVPGRTVTIDYGERGTVECPYYEWFPVTQVRFDGDEPDWRAIEIQAQIMSLDAYTADDPPAVRASWQRDIDWRIAEHEQELAAAR